MSPIPFTNDLGQTRWQPEDEFGEKLWARDAFAGPVVKWREHRPYDSFHYWEERLYRWRWRAVLSERLHARRVRATQWTLREDR